MGKPKCKLMVRKRTHFKLKHFVVYFVSSAGLGWVQYSSATERWESTNSKIYYNVSEMFNAEMSDAVDAKAPVFN